MNNENNIDVLKKELKKSIKITNIILIKEKVLTKVFFTPFLKFCFSINNFDDIEYSEYVDLLNENKVSCELLEIIKDLFIKIKKNNYTDEEKLYFYSIIFNYIEDVIKIRNNRIEKRDELVKKLELINSNINYISNKNFSDTKSNIKKIKLYSKYIKSLE